MDIFEWNAVFVLMGRSLVCSSAQLHDYAAVDCVRKELPALGVMQA